MRRKVFILCLVLCTFVFTFADKDNADIIKAEESVIDVLEDLQAAAGGHYGGGGHNDHQSSGYSSSGYTGGSSNGGKKYNNDNWDKHGSDWGKSGHKKYGNEGKWGDIWIAL